jgi:hypothetical protein
MKSILASCALVLLAVASNANASSLTLADVGAVDQLVPGGEATLPNSNPGTEAAWISQVLNIPLAQLNYTQIPNAISGGANWQQITGSTVLYAFNLGSEPSWFMLKTGSGGPYDHYLFSNQDDLNWAVIDFTDLGFDNVEIGKISHVGIASDPPAGDLTPVPEPASLTLFGLGLSATAAAVRRRRKA